MTSGADKQPNRDAAAGVFIAGPAFNAGRYGVACGEACKAVAQQLDLMGQLLAGIAGLELRIGQ